MPNALDWVVSNEESGSKLVSFLSKQLSPHYSSRQLKRMIEQNDCQVNGRIERFASTFLGTGDRVSLNLKNPQQNFNRQLEQSRILYEDEDLFIYDKPAEMNCDEQGIIALLKPSFPSIQLIHRLDRQTTGVLALAKNKTTFEALVNQFKQLQVSKSYQAIVDGILRPSKGHIENYLGKKHVYQGQTIWGEVPSFQGLYASTYWNCLEIGKKASLVRCFPKTGRTHQIRVHLAGLGHPILGDYQYGKKFTCLHNPPRYLLHAEEMGFIHPRTREKLIVQAILPEDFLDAYKKLFEGKTV
ncbi:RluA family pseudouridine synthase [Candidatus Protochlamydia sp. R18]|uniref:RluA family pseudouridine synthase n=1 Tax=Candidatus Protochlamydia sp. R18 TaxID=1353977 RepID=UPI0005A9F4F3|nr:RluA family pseudouridine synthase [Candidatus Protochlamydia sp. R18]